MFQGLHVRSELRYKQVYQGTGPACSPSNLLRRIEYINSRSFQLIPADVTTTQPPHPTVPTGPFPTVPITNFGGPTTAPPTFAAPIVPIVVINQGGPSSTAGVPQQFPQGTLAFTGSSSGVAAMFGFEALLVGGALACLDPERRRRRMAQFAYHRPKAFLHVTLPPMR
jgi:hypothetical protein